MTTPLRKLAREIRALAQKLDCDGWDRLRGLRLLHAISQVLEDGKRLNWPEVIGRAITLVDVLENGFVKESPKADRLSITLHTVRELADLLEAGRWAERIDNDTLPENPGAWTFALVGAVDVLNGDIGEDLESLGFAVIRTDDVDVIVATCKAGMTVLLATASWLVCNAGSLNAMLPVEEGFPAPHLRIAVADVDDFKTQVKARQAGARLLFDMPVDIAALIGELAGLAWMPRIAYRAMLVDDDVAVLELHANILRDAGFEVLAVDDPVTARDFIEEFSPDACILDVEMPACRGTDLAAMLRRDLRFARLPVIYLSAHADSAHQIDARHAGADDFLVKPVAECLLVVAVATRVRQFRMLTTVDRQRRSVWRRLDSLQKVLDVHAIVSEAATDGSIVEVNRKFCEVSGYGREELLGRNHRIIKSGHHPPAFFAEMWRTISGGVIWQGEVQNRRKDGTPYWVQSTVAPILGEDGRPKRYLSIRTDITEQKHLLSELNRRNRLLDVMRQALELFVTTGDLQGASAMLLDGMLILTESAYGFIGEVLHEAGDTPYLKTHAITNIAWNEETQKLYDEAKTSGMEFRNLDTLFGAVLCTGETVIANDPANDPRRGSLPAGHPPLEAFLGIPIHFGSRLVGMLGLANRPSGYDASVAEFLGSFASSYAGVIEAARLARYRQQAIDGLTQARNAAERADRAKSEFLASWGHGLRSPLNTLLGHAQLLLMDKQLGNAAREQVREIIGSGQLFAQMIGELIERADNLVRPAAAESLPLSMTSTSGGRHRILVAEDNPANQAILRMQLEVLGFEADIAVDGVEALKKWQSGGHDLILADRNMPGMDGLALTRAVRASEKDSGAYVPILAVTAVQYPEESALCRQAGMDDILPKPIEIDALRRMLDRWLPRTSPRMSQATDDLVVDTHQQRECKAPIDVDHLLRIVGRCEVKQMRELVDLFTATAHDTLPACRQHLAENNGRLLALAMHKLKSSAHMVGALCFAALAEAIEYVARDGRLKGAATLLPELEHTLQDVEAMAARFAVPPAPTFNEETSADTAVAILPRRTLIIDDDPVARRQMTLLLSSLGCGEVIAVDGADAALAEIALEDGGIDLLVTDLNMPGVDGIELLRRLAEMRYRGCLAIASGVEDRLVQAAADLARAKGISLLGTLKKPVTRTAMTQLLASTCGASSAITPPGIDVLPHDILDGIRRDEFEIHFQPKVDAITLRTVGVEALARWWRDGKPIAADAFIKAAERHGLIGQLSEVLFTKALIGGAQLAESGFPLTVAINLSANWLTDVNLPEFALASLHATDFPVERLILEITETGIMTDLAVSLDILTRLRLKGFRLSIDDFGIGYSSMEQLRRLPFSELKLDRGFVQDATGKPAARTILASSIEMARKLELTTVAEGVETQADLDLVRGLGCDLVQGWMIAKAMPIDQLIDWMRSRQT